MLKSSRLPWVDWHWKNVEGKEKSGVGDERSKIWQGFSKSRPPHELMVLTIPDPNITHTRAQLKYFDCNASL